MCILKLKTETLRRSAFTYTHTDTVTNCYRHSEKTESPSRTNIMYPVRNTN